MVSSNLFDGSLAVLASESQVDVVAERNARDSRRAATRRVRGLSVLALGVAPDRTFDGLKLHYAAGPREAIEMLRLMDFNLLLVSAGPEDTETWKMLEVVRSFWPGLRWVLLADECSDQHEILARSHGAASVTSDESVIHELARNRRK